MKLKSLLSIITICQFSGCGVYEAQVNDSIEVHNQGIENRVTSLENKIDALKQELNLLDIKNNQLEMMIHSQARDKSEQKLKLNHSENAKDSFESSFELLRKGDYVSAEIALREYIKGTETELKVGYETKVNNLKPYIEIGPAWEMKDGADDADFFKVIELGSKIKLTDDLGAKVKAEYAFNDDNEVDWKYEASLSYSF